MENESRTAGSSDAGNSGGTGTRPNNGAGQPPALKRRSDAANEAALQGNARVTSSAPGYLPLRQPEAGEEQVRGLLVRVDCDAKGVTFTVKVGDQMLKFRTTDLNSVQFTTFTPDVSGQMTCGARNPANDVLITFRPMKDARSKFNGDLVAVEFVPKDFEWKK